MPSNKGLTSFLLIAGFQETNLKTDNNQTVSVALVNTVGSKRTRGRTRVQTWLKQSMEACQEDLLTVGKWVPSELMAGDTTATFSNKSWC